MPAAQGGRTTSAVARNLHWRVGMFSRVEKLEGGSEVQTLRTQSKTECHMLRRHSYCKRGWRLFSLKTRRLDSFSTFFPHRHNLAMSRLGSGPGIAGIPICIPVLGQFRCRGSVASWEFLPAADWPHGSHRHPLSLFSWLRPGLEEQKPSGKIMQVHLSKLESRLVDDDGSVLGIF